MTLAPGTKLGPYEIVCLVGSGGMGEVYRARDTRLGRDVAVKIMPPDFARDPDRLRRFDQEARTAGLLSHPNILSIYDSGSQNGSPYVVSELLEGETLRDRLANQGVPTPRKLLEFAVQIAQGLCAAHEKGIIHRDLKPENLFVTKDGRIKILDFGLAKFALAAAGRPGTSESIDTVILGATTPGLVLGTVGYMSPEQARGQGADHRADIFSLGTILYEMATGRRAFEGASPVETMNAILKDEPPELTRVNPKMPAALERIVDHCLEKDPDCRFQTTRDLVFALESVSPVSSSSARLPQMPRRHLGKVLAGVLGAGALGGAFLLGRATVTPARQPRFQQLTFRRGPIRSARFSPDGETILYGAAWDGQPIRIFSRRRENPESQPLELPDAEILAVSSTGELAISLGHRYYGWSLHWGTLARVPLGSRGPRELAEHVVDADWTADGKSLAIIRNVGGKRRLESPIGTVLYETTGDLSHVRCSPDGTSIAVLEHPVRGDDRGAVVLFDARGKYRLLTDEFASAEGLAWNGDEIWFTAATQGSNCALYGVTSNRRQRAVLQVAGRLTLHDIAPDGRVLLAHHSYRTAMMIAGPSAEKERDLAWLDSSYVADITADGRLVLFTELGEGEGLYYGTYMRPADGGAAVRLGDGRADAFSPDGKWAMAVVPTAPRQVQMLPLRTGEPVPLNRTGLKLMHAGWFPDGSHLLFSAEDSDGEQRLYVQDAQEQQPPRPVSPPGISPPWAISPDGKRVVAIGPDRHIWLYSVEGAAPQPLPELEAGDAPVRWTAEPDAFYAWTRGRVPAHIYRFDLATRRKQPWRQITPMDPTGINAINTVALTPDGRTCVYTYDTLLSNLFLVEGLRS